jgi:hypothetical protein
MSQTHVADARVPVTVRAAGTPYLEWGPIFAGAIGAAALSFLLLTFGSAVGLSLTSPWPNSGVSAKTVAWAVAWWSVAAQIASFAAGGYLAGRLRSSWGDARSDEGQFRDGAHGFSVWALGVLFGAVLLGLTGASALKTAVQSGSNVAGGAAAGLSARADDSLRTGPTDYATDLLFRAGPAATPASAPAQGQNTDGQRTEASRIFAASIKNGEFSARDRDYLTQLVMMRTGLPQAEAQRRVDDAMNEAKTLEIKARDAADKARKAAIVAGFIAAASLLISLAVACFTAGLGGQHRDEGRSPHFHGRRFW